MGHVTAVEAFSQGKADYYSGLTKDGYPISYDGLQKELWKAGWDKAFKDDTEIDFYTWDENDPY